jgi:hypothetical protein
MIRINFCVAGSSSTVIPASPFGDLRRQAGTQIIPAQAGTQSFVCLRYEGLGPGLRRDDGNSFENVCKNVNPRIHLPSQAKTPQTAIQMRGFKS